MTPYWTNEQHGLSIYLGDCLAILPQLGREFDLCLTDPPYALTFGSCTPDTPAFHTLIANGWSETFGWVPMALDLMKHGAAFYCWMNDEGWSELKAVVTEHGGRPCGRLVVVKTNPMPALPRSNYRKATELVLYATVGDATAAFNADSQEDALPLFFAPICGGHERTKHPTQKPLSIIERMVRISSNRGDTILDPFLGSGTSLAAAYRLGRQGVGVEIDERYCQLAAERLEREIAQGRLFEPEETAPKPAQTTLEVDA